MSRAAVAKESGLSVEDVDKVFDAVVAICDRGGMVKIMGFGTFKPKSVQKRKGRNPMTGEAIMCKGYRTITFRGHTKLRQRMAKDE
jgi:nucleoid DNA-binding protein